MYIYSTIKITCACSCVRDPRGQKHDVQMQMHVLKYLRVHGTCVYTVGAKIKFKFSFHTTIVLRYEMSRSVFMDSSVLT